MKRILVPTDFSDAVRPAISFAANLARKSSGEIYLLHVIEAEDEYSGIPTSGEWHSYVNSVTAEVPYMIGKLRETKVIMDQLKKEPVFTNLHVVDNVEVGVPSSRINHAAKKYNADVIVMGTHGARGLQEIFIGSNAEKVVQHADRPVIAVKEETTPKVKTMLFATDFSHEADQIFDIVKEYADILEAKLHLLKVNTPETFESLVESRNHINKFREYHQAMDCPFDIYNDYSKESGILHFAKDIHADLIAIGTHGRHGLARFFNGSISEELVNHSLCPVMTVNFNK